MKTLEPEVIVTCLKRRFSGVSATIDVLLAPLGARVGLGYLGVSLPVMSAATGAPRLRRLSLLEAIGLSRRRLPDGRRRIWHVRRNAEMLLALVVRDVLRCPVSVVFTSAGIRRHSFFPRLLIARMDAVIATSPAAAALVPNVAAVVGHGVDVQRFHPQGSPLEAWASSGLPGKIGVGIFGRVRHEKGVHLFVEALLPLMAQHPDVTAVLVGLCKPADAAFVDGLRRQIDAAGLSERFIWTGERPFDEMPTWHRRMLVTVACPLYEGFGLTPIEAMASGAAVVASRTGAFESMIVDGQTGRLVPTGDVRALTEALGSILADTSAAVEMGRRGRARVETHFAADAEAAAIEGVYRDVWARDARA
ncbi:MAG: glycosyltransferase family 4 protein [Phycisphaerae bacterium]|nr:glycosyltransferase family 4 protein [Phycisphaerae bacterium]